jgi:CheY-like chemotaxis protein
MIVYVEDNESNITLIKRVADHLRIPIQTARTAADGLALIQAAPPQIILLDVNLPDVDGITLARHIRALGGGFATVPIVAITARAMTGDREVCLEAGFTEYLAKPFRIQELTDIIRKYITS